MSDPDLITRAWTIELIADEIRIRCKYRRRRRRVVQYTVQLEIRHEERWQPVVRYDTAHGFCHRDVIHADGSQDKTPVFYGDANETFTRAIEDVRANWEAHRARYLREVIQ
jgi:hypothetical protein